MNLIVLLEILRGQSLHIALIGEMQKNFKKNLGNGM